MRQAKKLTDRSVDKSRRSGLEFWETNGNVCLRVHHSSHDLQPNR